MLITRITSSHACLLFSCANLAFNLCWLHTTPLARVPRVWIFMLTARNGHFSSGNSCSRPWEQCRKNVRPWQSIWLSPNCRPWFLAFESTLHALFDPLMLANLLFFEYDHTFHIFPSRLSGELTSTKS